MSTNSLALILHLVPCFLQQYGALIPCLASPSPSPSPSRVPLASPYPSATLRPTPPHQNTLPPPARASSFDLPWIGAQPKPVIVAIHSHRLSFLFYSSVAARCITGRNLRIASHRIATYRYYSEPRVRIAKLLSDRLRIFVSETPTLAHRSYPPIAASLSCRAHGFSSLEYHGRSTITHSLLSRVLSFVLLSKR